jgi:hypothetical protein
LIKDKKVESAYETRRDREGEIKIEIELYWKIRTTFILFWDKF